MYQKYSIQPASPCQRPWYLRHIVCLTTKRMRLLSPASKIHREAKLVLSPLPWPFPLACWPGLPTPLQHQVLCPPWCLEAHVEALDTPGAEPRVLPECGEEAEATGSGRGSQHSRIGLSGPLTLAVLCFCWMSSPGVAHLSRPLLDARRVIGATASIPAGSFAVGHEASRVRNPQKYLPSRVQANKNFGGRV